MSLPIVQRLDWTANPLQIAAAWPTDRPLMMLHSGRRHARWARWSILASPRAVVTDLEVLDRRPPDHRRDLPVPFAGGWIGCFAYELGRRIEPAAVRPDGPAPADDRGWPEVLLGECRDALVHDHVTRTWFAVGEAAAWPREPRAEPFEVGTPESNIDPDTYLAMVASALEYIAAGDVFQVNLTRRLSAPLAGSTRGLGLAALAAAGAWYGAYLELPGGRAVLSMSPELFLDLDGGGAVVSRPVKGTRPAGVPARSLLDSPKDAAELNMIVDLMRNDLGRVCRPGTVRVPRQRIVETHPTVHHGVGEVAGVLAGEATRGDLLRATFPPGSITGAPKIRAMQIIEELEPVRRGPYCGAIGFLSDCGRAVLNVAIRTMSVTGARLDYGVGGGIVADSDPIAEYRETVDKAAILQRVPGLSRPASSAAAAPAGPSAGS